MGNQIQTIFSADAANVIQAQNEIIKRQQEHYKELQKTAKAAKDAEQASQSWTSKHTPALKGMVAEYLSATSAIHGMKAAYDLFTQSRVSFGKDIADAQAQVDALGSKLAIKLGLKSGRFAIENLVAPVALASGQSVESLAKEATVLGAEGVRAGDLKDVLAEVAKAKTVTGFEGELAPVLASFLDASGQEMTPENVHRAALSAFNLDQAGVFSIGDLGGAGKFAAQMRLAKLNQEEGLAAFALSGESLGGAEAGAAAINKLMLDARSGKYSDMANALSSGGLTGLLNLLGDQTAGMTEQKRAAFFATKFGAKQAAGIESLVSTRGDLARLVHAQSDEAGFIEALDTGTTDNKSLRRERLRTEKMLSSGAGGGVFGDYEEFQQIIENALIRQGSPFSKEIADKAFGFLQGFSGTPEESARRVAQAIPGLNPDDVLGQFQQLNRGYEGAGGGMDVQYKMLEEQKKTNEHLNGVKKNTRLQAGNSSDFGGSN